MFLLDFINDFVILYADDAVVIVEVNDKYNLQQKVWNLIEAVQKLV